jgi:hypothetical protein
VLVGWIAENNYGSIKNVLVNGYIKTEDERFESLDQLTDPVKFEKYKFDLLSNR